MQHHHSQRFQVPPQFQSSFTQMPLFRSSLNPRPKASQCYAFPMKGKVFLPSLRGRNSSLIPKEQSPQTFKKENVNPTLSLKSSFLSDMKALTMISSSVLHRPIDNYSKISGPDERLNRYKDFLKDVNNSNNVIVNADATDSSKKFIYYIGKGNNHHLVQSLIKTRFWWSQGPLQSANFVWTQIKRPVIFDLQNSKTIPNINLKTINPQNVHNHLPGNGNLGNKKSLYQNLKSFCEKQNINLFDIVPLTFHIGNEMQQFFNQFNRRQALKKQGQKINNIWIIKPGENSNRGQNIIVIDSLEQFTQILSKKSKEQTLIAQLYISKPFLYNRRKFDIRHYMMITSVNSLKGYWYKDGYIRTSSQLYQPNDVKNTQIHLTNDAIQKHSQKYGKYEEGNKLSYKQFQRYLNMTYADKKYDFSDVLEKMKQIATYAVKAVISDIDPQKKQFNFQIFGLDFMLDDDLRPWLIQINTNPCLQVTSRVLKSVIPSMVENSFRLALDPLFPPPNKYPNSHKQSIPQISLNLLKYEIIYDSNKNIQK